MELATELVVLVGGLLNAVLIGFQIKENRAVSQKKSQILDF